MKTTLPLRPPVYDDTEKDYQAKLFFQLAWAWVISFTILKLLEIALVPQYWMRHATIIALVGVSAITCLLLNRQKHLLLASAVFPGILWLIITVLALTSGGIHSPTIGIYVPIILCTGLLLGGRAGIIMAASCIIAALIFVIMEMKGMLPQPWIIVTSTARWIVYSISVLQICATQYWVALNIKASFQRMKADKKEREHLEMELKESEFSYQIIADNRILGVAWVSPGGLILKGNAAIFSLLGYTQGELRGVHFGTLTHPDDFQREMELIDKIKKHEIDNYLIEKRFRHKNGNYFWVELNRTAYYDPVTGEVDFYIAIIQNIQQRKEAEESLKMSEEKYRALVDNAVEALIVVDVEKDAFVRFSESALQLFKASNEELFKMKPADLSPVYQPNGRASADMAAEKLQEAVNGAKPVFEWTLLDSTGRQIPTEVRLVRLPSADSIIIRGSIIDISERKKKEEELNLAYQHFNYLVENTPLAVVEYDKDIYIKRWSKRAEEIFGWSAQEVLGKSIYDPDFRIIYTEDVKAVNKITDELTQGKSNMSINRNYTKSGAVIYCEWYNSVLKDVSGNIISVLSLAHNVTERKEAEEGLKASNERLRQLSSHLQTVREEERTAVAREIHDELGQQLTALKMATSWFKNEIPGANQAAHQKASDMMALIDDTITTVNKISSNLRPSVLDNLGLQAALEWQSSEFENRTGIKSNLLIKPGDHLIDKDISTCVFRVYQEALTNIIRHSHATETDTTFEIADNFITLEIRDNGIGFDASGLDRKKNFGLTGMEERAHMFNGELKIESEPAKGTTITLKIPFISQPAKTWA